MVESKFPYLVTVKQDTIGHSSVHTSLDNEHHRWQKVGTDHTTLPWDPLAVVYLNHHVGVTSCRTCPGRTASETV